MGSERQRACLGDILTQIIDHRGRTPKKLGGDFCSSGIRVLSAKNVKNGCIDYTSDMRYVSQEMYQRWMPVKLKRGDVLLTSEAPLGETAYLRDDIEFCLGQRLFALRANETILHSRYLYYYLRSRKGQHELHARATGTTAQGIRQSELVKIEIEYPPDTGEQRAIAHILGTLDDKIELNRRMNETLEAMARALFKSWFVDFDPVIDNALAAGNPIPDALAEKAARRRALGEKRKPLPEEVRCLFPARFVDSELGPIPEGWENVSLGDVVEIYDSKRIPLSRRERERRQGPYPYYGATGVMDYVDDYLFDGIYILMAEDGSVLDDNDKPVLQYVWGKFWVNNHAHVLLAKKPISNEYLFLALGHVHLLPFVTGAVQLKLNQRNMKSIPFILPTSRACTLFQDLTGLLFAKYRFLTEESRTLAALRDTLLPKLISGEIRITDTERILEGVV